MGNPNISFSWSCDWCNSALAYINDRIMCPNCRKYFGKDGKEHLIINGLFVEKQHEEPQWGEQHTGKLIDFDNNEPTFKKIFKQLHETAQQLKITNYEITGRIKDEGMLKGKISRCQTEQDRKTTEYEELGYRIITKDFIDLTLIRDALIIGADFVKDYINQPRQDGKILGENPNLQYIGFHIYTQHIQNKKIEIQIYTKKMFDQNMALVHKYGGYWKTKEFKEKRLAMGDDR